MNHMKETSAAPGQHGNQFATVAELMFTPPLTDEQYRAVIANGLNSRTYPNIEDCDMALHYARENIEDPYAFAEAQLFIGERGNVDISELPGRDDPSWYNDALDKNRRQADFAIASAETVLALEAGAATDLFPRAFRLVKQLQAAKTWDYAEEGTDEVKERFNEVGTLALNFIARAREDDAEELLGSDLPHAYLDQLRWVNRHAQAVEGASRAAMNVYRRLIQSVNEDTDGAVDFCIEVAEFIEQRGTAVDVPSERVLARAVGVARHSSREPIQEEQRSRLGFKRVSKQPSLFEQRRARLHDYIGNEIEIAVHLKRRPEIVQNVVGLFENAEEQHQVWQGFTDQLIARYFDRDGNYDLAKIQSLPAELNTLGEVAPPQVVDEARAMVQRRMELSVSSR